MGIREGQLLKSTNQIAPLLVQYFPSIGTGSPCHRKAKSLVYRGFCYTSGCSTSYGPGNVPNDPTHISYIAMVYKTKNINFDLKGKPSRTLHLFLEHLGILFRAKQQVGAQTEFPFFLDTLGNHFKSACIIEIFFIGHFTGACLDTKPLSRVLIQTLLAMF